MSASVTARTSRNSGGAYRFSALAATWNTGQIETPISYYYYLCSNFGHGFLDPETTGQIQAAALPRTRRCMRP
ncbi:hypothetical protein [Actinoallomurus sp. NPDC050550]|uniref:hypothetical protein n=1 Tax=Actinoallomurus sp. NPDC050550 TaxID=3154937 RepID=UPI0033C31A40